MAKERLTVPMQSRTGSTSKASSRNFLPRGSASKCRSTYPEKLISLAPRLSLLTKSSKVLVPSTQPIWHQPKSSYSSINVSQKPGGSWKKLSEHEICGDLILAWSRRSGVDASGGVFREFEVNKPFGQNPVSRHNDSLGKSVHSISPNLNNNPFSYKIN